VLTFGSFLSLTALGVSAFLAAYILGANPKGAANRAFFVLMLAFVFWDICEALVRSMPTGAPEATLYAWIQGVWLGISLVPAALLHVTLAYPEPSPWARKPWLLGLVYLPFFAWAYLVVGTSYVITGVSANPFGPSALVAPTYSYAAGAYGIWLYLGVAYFVRGWWRAHGAARKMQGLVAAGLILGTLPAGVTEILWPVLTTYDTPLGLASIYTLVWSIIIAYAIARYHYLVIEPVMEVPPTRPSVHAFERGLNYLVLEDGRSTAMGAFREIVSKTPGLCVTALPPSHVVARFGLERTPILWVTTASTADRSVRPGSLEFELLHGVTKFLRENPGTAVLLDDLDYLSELDGFDAVARFLKRVMNQASASGGTVIAAVGHGTFGPERIAVLRGSADRVVEVPLDSAPVVTADAGSVLLMASSQDAPAALAASGARGGLLLTTEHPTKARSRYGEGWEVIWATDVKAPGVPRVQPNALDTESRRALVNYAVAHRGADLVVAGLEQFALFNDFRKILAFVKDAVDLASLAGCRLRVILNPEALPPREVAMLARRFDMPGGAIALRSSPLSGPTTAAPGNRTPYRGPAS